MTASTPLELKLHAALKRITAYMPPEKLRRQAEKEYGLEYEEALEAAYENVLDEAKAALKGVRLLKAIHPIQNASPLT